MTEGLPEPPVRIVAFVGEGSVSPLNLAPWQEVMLHTVSTDFEKSKIEIRSRIDRFCRFGKLKIEENL